VAASFPCNVALFSYLLVAAPNLSTRLTAVCRGLFKLGQITAYDSPARAALQHRITIG
jgi:hypothetical protein